MTAEEQHRDWMRKVVAEYEKQPTWDRFLPFPGQPRTISHGLTPSLFSSQQPPSSDPSDLQTTTEPFKRESPHTFMSLLQHANPLADTEFTLAARAPEGRRIIGFEVISQWDDTNGEARPSSHSAEKVEVRIMPCMFRGADWELKVFHVDASKYAL